MVKTKESLLKQYIGSQDDMPGALMEWSEYYRKNQDFLYTLFDLISKGESIVKDEINDLVYEKKNGLWNIMGEKIEIDISEKALKKIAQLTADMYESMLPNGTIVDLKKEMMSNNMKTNVPENVRLIVQSRYSFKDDTNVYFPYGGTVYPFGTLAGQQQLYFTPNLIKEVIFLGYNDEQEEAFELALKEELLIDEEMVSVSFAGKDELDAFQKSIF